MANDPVRSSPADWDPGPIIDWLLEEGRFLADVDDVARRLGERMHASGAPLWRLRLSMRTLHPLMTAITSVWERDSDATTFIETPHGLEGRSGYIGSPLEIIARTRRPLRKRLAEALSETDHNVLHDLKARGGTDYFGLPMKFSNVATASLVFTTDSKGGFSERDIENFTRIASILAPITEVFNAKLVSLAVAEAGASVLVIVPVVLTYGPPGTELVTSTVIVQLPPAGMTAPIRSILVPPATAVSTPAQSVAALCGVALTISAG